MTFEDIDRLCRDLQARPEVAKVVFNTNPRHGVARIDLHVIAPVSDELQELRARLMRDIEQLRGAGQEIYSRFVAYPSAEAFRAREAENLLDQL